MKISNYEKKKKFARASPSLDSVQPFMKKALKHNNGDFPAVQEVLHEAELEAFHQFIDQHQKEQQARKQLSERNTVSCDQIAAQKIQNCNGLRTKTLAKRRMLD